MICMSHTDRMSFVNRGRCESSGSRPDQVQFQKDCEAHGVTYIPARCVNDVAELLNFRPLF